MAELEIEREHIYSCSNPDSAQQILIWAGSDTPPVSLIFVMFVHLFLLIEIPPFPFEILTCLNLCGLNHANFPIYYPVKKNMGYYLRDIDIYRYSIEQNNHF